MRTIAPLILALALAGCATTNQDSHPPLPTRPGHATPPAKPKIVMRVVPGKRDAGDACFGDSLAVGACKALGWRTYGYVGLHSCALLGLIPKNVHFRVAVISLGVNDSAPAACVKRARALIDADEIVWITGASPAAAAADRLARGPGDRFVDYAKGGPGVWPHPPNYDYAPLAASVRSAT